MVKRDISVIDDFSEDPNKGVITDFMRMEFPEVIGSQQESVVGGVVAEFIGSRQVRLGGRPTPESEVAMRAVARDCIFRQRPIPVLVGAGPKKPVSGASIDIAELSALKTLACLNKRIQVYYPPGIVVRIRLEDATGYYLEEGVKGLHDSIERYIGDFCALTRILGYNFISPVRERDLVDPAKLKFAADQISPLILDYLQESESVPEDQWQNLGAWKRLHKIGWQGSISNEARKYYDERYRKLFPEMTGKERIELTAKYFGNTLARYQLHATGALSSWPGYFQINFAPPIPGVPKELTTTRIYYRTVPQKHTDRHMPFWRAKGYLRLNGTTKISLASFHEKLNFNPFAVVFSNGKETVSVQSDYVLVD
jgi:hypothetical protein